MAKDYEMVTCPYCDGVGDVMDSSKVRYNTISPPYVKCPACNGGGEVPEDEVENIDVHLSVSSYEKQNRDEAAINRWEMEKDEGRGGGRR